MEVKIRGIGVHQKNLFHAETSDRVLSFGNPILLKDNDPQLC